MKTKDLINSIDKIEMTQADEQDILNGISEKQSKKSKNRFSYKRKMKLPVAACVALLIISLGCSNTVRATVCNVGTNFFNFLSSDRKLDVQNIGESGIEKPITLSKDGVTVTLNQCIFSNSEMFLDYTIETDNAKEKMMEDKINTGYAIYDGDKYITDKLFKKWISGEGTASFIDPKAEDVCDENTVEWVEIVNGDGFKFEGKTLKIVIGVYEGNKKTEFPFEINVNKLYPEKSKKINEKVLDKNGKEILIEEVKNTFSNVIITGIGPLEDPNQIKITDKSGETLRFQGCGIGTEENTPFEYVLSRNNLENTNEYTVKVYDTDDNLLKEIPITLDSVETEK